MDRFWQKAHAMTSIFIEGCHAGPSATRSTGAYGEQGRRAPFVVTIAVILFIVVTFLQWIDHLSQLGRVTETTRRVEETTLRAVEARQTAPNLGGYPLQEKDKTPGRQCCIRQRPRWLRPAVTRAACSRCVGVPAYRVHRGKPDNRANATDKKHRIVARAVGEYPHDRSGGPVC